MKKREMRINTKIEVISGDELYLSSVQDIQDGFITINIPAGNSKYLTLDIGSVIEYTYFIEGDTCYKCMGKVIRKFKENNIPLYMITKPYNIVKIQRRNFVRVATIEYMFFGLKDWEDTQWKKGILIDLSGGGIKLKATDEFNINDILKINLIDANEKIPLFGKIVRKESRENGEGTYGVEFIDIEETKREKIISKVFKVMIKQRKLV